MAHDHDGAEARFGLAGVDGPSEEFLGKLATLSLGNEARLAEAVAVLVSVCKRRNRKSNLRIRFANAELDVDEVGVLNDARLIEKDLVEQVSAELTHLLDHAHITRIERGDTDFSVRVRVVRPVLRVETDNDHVVGRRRHALELD
jgi:hypothetical protein